MEWRQIQSSNIQAARWIDNRSDEGGTLQVIFRNGRVYEYYHVNETVFEDWTRMPVSKGWFFNTYVKGIYKHKEISLDLEEE